MTLSGSTLLALPAALLLGACSGSREGGTGVAVVTVTPAAAALCIGDTLTFGARLLDASGDPVTSSSVRWSSSAPALVAVDSESGLVHALAFGAAQITASVGGLRSVTPGRLDVPSDLVPETVPDTVVLAPGDTFTLGTRLRRLSVGPWPAHAAAIAPLDTAPASVTASGLVTAKTSGTATFSVSGCGFTGQGSAQVFAPPDSLTGTGRLWLSGSRELRARLGAVAFNFTLLNKKPAFQLFGNTTTNTIQYAYEDTVPLSGPGTFELDSLRSQEVSASLPCAAPRPFAVYGDASSSVTLLSMHGGSAAVTTYVRHTGWGAVSGRVVGQMSGFLGLTSKLDTLKVVYTFSAPLRDSTNYCQ